MLSHESGNSEKEENSPIAWIPACAGTSPDRRFRGGDTLVLARRGKAELFHSAKMFHKNLWYSPIGGWSDMPKAKLRGKVTF